MENIETLDEDFTTDLASKLNSDKKKYLKWILILLVINTVLFTFLIEGTRSTTGNFSAAIYANLFGFNILGFILGIIFALFPYKSLPFNKKYVRASLLTILTIHIFMLISLIFIGIFKLVRMG